ncbi:EAL and HDOD domain-containing protein [Variovorax sp. RHLX14]|uniref:EAL and HDOD domain-containing protein n=1 Tax=Variovorax sp. RHLX14 TaxID=1259731 RepID=UPI003F46FE1F
MGTDNSKHDPMASVLLGRQPIVNRVGALVAYELLFRGGPMNEAAIADDQSATDQVIVNAISQFGVAGSLGQHRGFVNIGRASLGSDSILLLEPDRFTLEILENVEIDSEVEAECRRLREAGFQIALDDVISIDRIPPRVLDLVDIVKIDLRSVVMAEVPSLIRKAHEAGCAVLAEKVESFEEYRQILDLGADLFQGYFFARPEILRQNQMSASQSALLKLNSVLAADPKLSDLQLEVKRNPVLLAQLMKFAGSASAAASGRGELTVGDAIARVGTRQLARLAQLLLFAGDSGKHLEDNPLLQLVNTRARFMELMAHEIEPDDDAFADAAFQAGIFSLMHVVTGQSSEQMLAQVALSPRIESAILSFEGALGDLLLMARYMEGFDPTESNHVLSRCEIDCDRLSALFARATGDALRD